MTLSDHLIALSDDQLRALLERRPDLGRQAYGYPPRSFDDLANRAGSWPSQAAAVASLDQFESAVLNLTLLVGPEGSIDDLVRESGGLLDADGARAGVAALAALALMWVDAADRWHAAGQMRSQLLHPFDLGRPFALLAAKLPKDELVSIAHALGIEAVVSNSKDRRKGRGAPVKADYASAIVEVLADRNRVEQLLEGCPYRDLAETYAREVAPSVPLIDIFDGSNPYITYLRPGLGRASTPTDWFLDRGLLVARPDRHSAEIPREVGLAWRGGRPTDAIARHASPVVAVDAGTPGAVDGAASAAALELISGVTAIVNEVRDRPLKANRSGGVGVRAVASLAKKLGRDPRPVAQLLELGHIADLLTMTQDRQDVLVVAGGGADEWTAAPPAEQWLALVHTWWHSRRMVAHAGGRNIDDKPINPIGARPTLFASLAQARRQLVRAVASVPPDRAAEPTSVASHLEFASTLWTGDDPDNTGGGSVYEALRSEAELLGATAAGGVPTPLRRVVEDDWDGARSAAADLLPEVTDELLVQPDLTIVAPGPVSADLSRLLDLMATVESRGGATTWRLSPSTVRDAFDAGYTTAMLIDVLDRHALTGIPQPVRYLLDDVDRRYGSVRIRAAAAVVRSDDEALLATVVAHRKLARVLALVAPTVAVSSLGEAALLGELRAAGFLPVLESDDGTLVLEAVSATPPSDEGTRARQPSRPAAVDDGEVPWWRRPPPERRWAGPPVDLDSLIARLRAGPPDVSTAVRPQHSGAFEQAMTEFDMAPPEILAVLLRARQREGAVLVSPYDHDEVVGLVSDISTEHVVIACADCGNDHRFPLAQIAAVEDSDDIEAWD